MTVTGQTAGNPAQFAVPDRFFNTGAVRPQAGTIRGGNAADGNGAGALDWLSKYLDEVSTPNTERRGRELANLHSLLKGAARHRAQIELQWIDSAVKAHEKAHMAILGGAAGSGIQYSYVTGHGGQRYAVGGSIKVDFQPVPGDPEATIDKARKIRLAALAPGNPSPADMRAAAKAYRMEQEAREDLREAEAMDKAAAAAEAGESGAGTVRAGKREKDAGGMPAIRALSGGIVDLQI
jgi:hypothetical protein